MATELEQPLELGRALDLLGDDRHAERAGESARSRRRPASRTGSARPDRRRRSWRRTWRGRRGAAGLGRLGCERGQRSADRAAVGHLGAIAVHKWTRCPFGGRGWPVVYINRTVAPTRSVRVRFLDAGGVEPANHPPARPGCPVSAHRPAPQPPYPAQLTLTFAGGDAPRELQLARHERHGAAAAVADDLERAAGADPLLGHEPLEVVDAADREAVDSDDEILRTQAGGRGG